jgi:CheY-like chemotaxis protein
MLGHELRNPLAPILTALELMRMRGGDVLLKERTVIERQVQHLVRLVDDLLDVSRIMRGRVELKRRRIELGVAVGSAVEMASPLLEERAHRLVVEVPPAGLTVHADEVRLAQVIANLLTNAAKYTEPGGLITVRARRDGDRATLSVRDTGAGIGPELLPRVFDLFVQGARTLERAQGGLGLGLTIVKNLVALHGGSVAVHSAGPGRGSEFVVQLPLALAAATRDETRDSSPAGAPVTDATTARRILVVDDNVDAAEVLCDALRTLGFDVRTAFDGPGALELAPSFRPELALLDLGLPVMDGFELARRLRETCGAGIALVAITGYGQDTDRERSLAAGFHEHLVKPVELEAVQQAIARLLD